MGGIVIETNGIQLGALNFSEGAGVNNAQCADAAFALDLSRLNGSFARLSWPGQTNRSYEIFSGTNAAAPLTRVTNLPGKFFEMEWISALTNSAERFFRVRARPAP